MGAEKRDMPEPTEVQAADQTPPVKITFSSEQQVKVDSLLKEAMGRAGSEARATAARLQSEMNKLQAELKAAKEAAAVASGDVVKAKDAEIEKAKAETVAVRKQNAITEAGAKYNFYDPGKQLAKLTQDQIKWSNELNRFVVVADDGTPRVSLDGSTPLTVDEFFREFATKNPHLVKGEVKPGVGSRENQLPTPAVGERERISKLFGKGSDSRAANILALSNPAEFKRQRYLARSYGLI